MGWFSRKPKPLVIAFGDPASGHAFWDGRHAAIEHLRPGVGVFELRRQRDNEVDRNAVQLHSPQGPIAYLGAEDAARIGRVLDKLRQPLHLQATLTKHQGYWNVDFLLPSTRQLTAWLREMKAL